MLTVKLPSLLPRFTVCDQRKNMTAKSNHYTWKCNTNASRVLSCRSPLAGREPGRCWTCRSRSGPQSPPSPSHGSGRRPLETWELVFPRYFLKPHNEAISFPRCFFKPNNEAITRLQRLSWVLTIKRWGIFRTCQIPARNSGQCNIFLQPSPPPPSIS